MIKNKDAGLTAIMRCFKNISVPYAPQDHTYLCPKPADMVNKVPALNFTHKRSHYDKGEQSDHEAEKDNKSIYTIYDLYKSKN